MCDKSVLYPPICPFGPCSCYCEETPAPTPEPTPTVGPCVGDCNGDGTVTISDLIIGVNIALGTMPANACPAFQNPQGKVDIAQIIKGVDNALTGCDAS